MQIGAQLYTVRAFTQTEKDFAETIKKIADMGYRTAQLSAAGPIPARTVADICAAHGVQIVVTHTNPDRIKAETDSVIEDHRIMGAGYVGIGSMPGDYHTGEPADVLDGIRRFIEDFKPAAQKLKAAGMKLMYHNHDFEFEKFGGKRMMEHLADGFAADELGFILDTYWVQAAGGDPAAWLEKLSGRVDVIHFKDMKVHKNERRMCEVMDGNLNWPAVFAACPKAGVLHAMVEQDDSYSADPFECLRKSFDNLTHRG